MRHQILNNVLHRSKWYDYHLGDYNQELKAHAAHQLWCTLQGFLDNETCRSEDVTRPWPPQAVHAPAHPHGQAASSWFPYTIYWSVPCCGTHTAWMVPKDHYPLSSDVIIPCSIRLQGMPRSANALSTISFNQR